MSNISFVRTRLSSVKPNVTQAVRSQADKSGQTSQKQGIGFKKVHKIKACFVCKSTDHLIKDCDFYKSPEPRVKNVVNTGERVVKPVWDYGKRVNHQNFSNNLKYPHAKRTFNPSAILTRIGLANTDRSNVSTARSINTVRPVYTVRLIRTARLLALKIAQSNRLSSRSCYRIIQVWIVVCSSHMTATKPYLSGYEDDFQWRLYGFWKNELKFNLFSVSQMCDKKNSVLFTESECLILSPSFKLLDESQVVLRAPRKDDVYSLDLKNIVPSGGITCLYANATTDESKLWHRRLGHVNFKNINKLVKGHLVRGLPSKVFVNDHTCVACKKGKQHKASCKAKLDRIIRKPLELLHMDLFGPVFIERINKKRCDNETEFKNYAMNEFCAKKGIKREFSQFDGKSDEGYLLGYSTSIKVFRVYNKSTKRVEENLHINFLEDQPNVAGTGYLWMLGAKDSSVAGCTRTSFLVNVLQSRVMGIQDSEMMFLDKEGQNQLPIDKQTTAFDEEKRRFASNKKASSSYHAAASSSTADLEDASDTLPTNGIFNRAYDDDEDVGTVSDFNNMANTIAVSPIPILRIHKDHLKGQILGDPTSAVQTRGKIQKASSAQQALEKVIGTKWVFRNKRDERSIVMKNKARLVAQGFRQEEGIDYDDVFAPVAKIEAIRLFLAFASYMRFTVYQMDVKSAFLYGTIEEEVYVHHPPGFVDPAHPNKVYKVIKALYGLHQAPRAWYETLSSFLIENGFRRGTIDKTLFIKKKKSDIMLVQVYVDDIIFGSTKKSMCTKFEDCMHKRFQMSSMGELTFFLGHQVKQQPDGIFISQDKYVADILKKFDFLSIRIATTPIESNKPLVKDEDGVDVDVHVYRSMIGSLMYLTASRPDIMFVICACARFQVTPKDSHLNAVKRIFMYLKHQPKLGLWYPRDSPFKLEAFLNSDYAGASLDRKSTIGGCQFLGRRLISWECKKQTIVANSTTEAEYVVAANCCWQVLWIQNQMMDYGFNFMNTKIHIDNKSTISVIKNLVAHSRTKHIEIRFHFIRDCYEKRLIEVIKIHTDHNVADLLTKGFDVTRFNFLVITAKSRIVNNISYIDATVVGKHVTISEASIRSYLLFDDADGIDSLNNQAIFDNIQLMGPSPSIAIPDSNPEVSGGNHGGQSSNDASLSGNEDGLTLQSIYDLYVSLCKHVTALAKEIKALKAQVKKLKKGVKPLITHHKAWMNSVALKTRLARKTSLKKKGGTKGVLHKDLAFEDLDDFVDVDDTLDYMETEDDQDEGRTSSVVLEEKESADKEVSTEAPISTDKQDEGTDKRNEGTDKQDGNTDSTKVSTNRQVEVLIIMSQNKKKLKEKEKGVELKDVEEIEIPRPTSIRSLLTLRPLPKIDPKAKGKGKIKEEDESDTKSEDITEAEKKFKQLANDEEMTRKVQNKWEAEEEKKRLAEEEDTKVALSNEYDFIQARLNADKILAKKLQEEEREMNQMMTYLKHVGGKKHFDLKTKSFDEIQVLYEKIKRSDDSFIAIGSAEDEKIIKEMNEQAADVSKKRVKKDDSVKGEIKEEEGTRKRKLGKRKKMKSKKRKFTSKDDEELRLCLTIAPDEDKEVDYEILDKKYPIIEWRSEYLTTKPQYDETEEVEDVYLNVVIRSNRQRRYFSTLMAVLSILDRDDICAIYQLVMNRYQDETPEGFDKIL
ncbi:putative ribonuclease H-like domain-containing protein [Tanacetum coccineum]